MSCAERVCFFLSLSKSIAAGAQFAFAAGMAVAAVLWLGGCATTPAYKNATHFTTVVVDAGHGGIDSGTRSHSADESRSTPKKRSLAKGGKGRQKPVVVRPPKVPAVHLLEKDAALDVALRLRGKLREAGLRVVMTRSDDTFIPLDGRVDISNAQHNSIFVSIHFNDSPQRAIHGTETYQNGRGTNELAHRIERAVSSCPGGVNRGVTQARFRVLRNSRGPAVLVECGYLSNAEEAFRIASPAFREQIASALARAIVEQRDAF
jgi:N-acetylmuramoyl-L-alanine amidase